MADRKTLVLGNWKMNSLELDLASAWTRMTLTEDDGSPSTVDRDAVSLWVEAWASLPEVDATVGIAPSFTSIDEARRAITSQSVSLLVGAQTAIAADYGAYTGDVSPAMLAQMGCGFVILGHSEQRRYHPEADDEIAAKAKAVIKAGMTPVICIGETAMGRVEGIGVDYALSQLADAMSMLDCHEASQVVIAYEPVWAIGTGKAPEPSVVEAALADVRDFVNAGFGADVAASVRLLYGGSVNEENAAGLAQLHDVDGFLVGGASLSPYSFHKACEAAVSATSLPRPTGGLSAVAPEAIDVDPVDEGLARETERRADTTAWRLQLALAAYRVMGFQWLEAQAAGKVEAGCVPENYPDLLRDEIWEHRLTVVQRLLSVIREGRVRGVSSAGEWLVATDDSLTGDDKCHALAMERAKAAADRYWSGKKADLEKIASGETEIPSSVLPSSTTESPSIIPSQTTGEMKQSVAKALAEMLMGDEGAERTVKGLFIEGYMAADADTRNRHWMRRGVDKTATGRK